MCIRPLQASRIREPTHFRLQLSRLQAASAEAFHRFRGVMLGFLGEMIKGKLHARKISVSVDVQYVEERKTGVIPPMRFKPKEIRAMERGLSSERFAENEFASVYRCSLSDGTIVAVKQLKPGAIQGESKFMDLINTMDSASHPNLNSLLGYCFTKDCQTLVFEFAENNNLSHHLHGKSGLSWVTRVKIAKGVAHALSYLHHECHPQIIHRDIKPANILLKDTFDAQVSDFGFTKLENMRRPYVVTSAIKTAGYIAPEYWLGDSLTAESDVYSFGIILLEILTGRTPEEGVSDEFTCIDDWAEKYVKYALESGNFSGVVDPKLKGVYNMDEVSKMAKVILGCIEDEPADRPTMAEVLEVLEGKSDFLLGRGRDKKFRDARRTSLWDAVGYTGRMVGPSSSYADVPKV